MPYRVLLLLFLITGVARAHPLDLGLVQAKVGPSGMAVTLDVNPQVAASLLGLELMQLSPPAVESRAAELQRATLASGRLTLGGSECAWGVPTAELKAQAVRLAARAECPTVVGRLAWDLPFVRSPKVPRTFQVMVKAEWGGDDRVAMADAASPHVEMEITGSPAGFGRFVVMGVEHIGAAPNQWVTAGRVHLPDGIDHILFLVALILGGGTFLQLVATATGFTVGHSITLVMGTLGVVHLPQRLVESAIALSIAYVAAETLVKKDVRQRWKIALLFGLVHGFGFASALTELHLSRASLAGALFGFNLGVECGQAILIALLAPLFAWLRHLPALRGYAVPTCSVVVFLCGSWWFIQRAFLAP